LEIGLDILNLRPSRVGRIPSWISQDERATAGVTVGQYV